MKLFFIYQTQHTGYDTYDSAVVAAPNDNAARLINPSNGGAHEEWTDESWCTDPKYVVVEYLGKAAKHFKQGIICASFNAR